MHVVIATVYSFLVWLAVLAWAAIAGAPGSVFLVVLLSPIVVSGVMTALLASWYAWRSARWLWRNRATLRLRRSMRA